MSILVMEKVRLSTIGSQTSKSVLYVLASYADDNGRDVHPSVATLAKDTELARSTISIALKGLEKDGLIYRGGKKRKGTVIYHINLEALAKLPQRGEQTDKRRLNPEALDSADTNVRAQKHERKGIREPDTNLSGSRIQTVKEPINNTIVEKSVDREKSFSPDVPDEIESAIEIYNAVAKQRGWLQCKSASIFKIETLLADCIRQVGGIEAWKIIMQKAGESDFLCGKAPDRPFKNNLTYLLKNFKKLLSGGFQNQGKAARCKPVSSSEVNAREMGRILADVAQKFRVENWKLRSKKYSAQFPEAVSDALILMRQQGFPEGEIHAFMTPQVAE